MSECPPLPPLTSLNLSAGEELVQQQQGCCPTAVKRCNTLLCPPPPAASDCPPFAEVRPQQLNGSCCPTYACGKAIYKDVKFKFRDPASRIRIRAYSSFFQRCGSGYESAWINFDWSAGSRSRSGLGGQSDSKNWKKWRYFMFEVLDVIFLVIKASLVAGTSFMKGLGWNKLQYLIKTIGFFQLIQIFSFSHQNPGSGYKTGSWSRSALTSNAGSESVSGSTLKPMRIPLDQQTLS